MPAKNKVRVILVTDGDSVAQEALEDIAKSLNLRCISASGGNPTPISGKKIVELLKEVPIDPVLVMFDDRGKSEKFHGEMALEFVATHPDVEVLGAVAVASNTTGIEGIAANMSVDASGKVMAGAAVNKHGALKDSGGKGPIIAGDTVDVLNDVEIPLVVGVGDIGKMDKADDIGRGCPITRKAVEEILKRSGIDCEQPR